MAHPTVIADWPAVTVRQTAVSTMDNNVYLLTAKSSGAQILIDAAADPAAIKRLLASAQADAAAPTRLAAVVTTHSHWDHRRALKAVVDAATGPQGAPAEPGGPPAATRPLTVAGAADAAEIAATTGVAIDQPAGHGDTVAVAGLSLGVIGLRGHTPGSIALVLAQPGYPVQLFSGDSLFPGGVGNTKGDPARFAQLLADVTERVFAAFPDDTAVHPGHGRSTTLGAERPSLAAWRARGW
jgi:glyoxylase-like metal-dependent hydrolase (beta-lactamase superfamily II)